MTRKFRPMALLLIFLVLSFFLQSTQGIEPYLRKNCTFGEYNASEFITFTMQGPSIGENSKKVERRVDLIKSDIEVSLNIESSLQIRLKVAPIVGNVSPYGLNIKQICNIYDHTCSNWAYVNDPRGLDWFQDATNILTTGDSCRKVGMGDCDDFAILIASFVENIGGATMVVVSSDPDGKSGHAYAEVYMGRIGEDDQNINNIIEWLRKKYNNENIGYDIPNPANGEVWLNLDYNSLCPGGPALKMAKNIPLVLREGINKVPLKPWDESLSIRHSFVPDLQQNQSEYR